MKWSWLNEDKTEIVKTWDAGTPLTIKYPDGSRRQAITHPNEILVYSGALPHIYPGIGRWQSLGELIIEPDRISKEVVTMSAADIRIGLEKEVYSICQQHLSAATAEYSPAEMSQWAAMVSNAEAGNWTYFDNMTNNGTTSEQYGAIVLLKHAALKAYFDATLAARNQHKTALANIADADLINYDTSTLWI